MSEIEELRTEIARLRTVCEEFGIDPDWRPEPIHYGPPQLWEVNLGAMISATLNARAPQIAKALTNQNPLLRRLTKAIPYV